MYDSVNPESIPTYATVVAGYVDGLYEWTPAGWARFPNARHVRIAVFASTDDGQVLDVETGDATPVQAPGWVRMRRESANQASGPITVYCDVSNWPAVRGAFAEQGVDEPDYWIAHYDGVAELLAGAVAKQFQSIAAWDVSITADPWPSAPAPPPPAPDPPSPPPPAPPQINPEAPVQDIQIELGIDSAGNGQYETSLALGRVQALTALVGAGPNNGYLFLAPGGRNGHDLIVGKGWAPNTPIPVRVAYV